MMKTKFYVSALISTFISTLSAAFFTEGEVVPAATFSIPNGLPKFEQYNPNNNHISPIPKELEPFVTNIGMSGQSTVTLTEEQSRTFERLYRGKHYISVVIRRKEQASTSA